MHSAVCGRAVRCRAVRAGAGARALPPQAPTMAEGAHESHRLVPKCMIARSAAPSAASSSLCPAPPTTWWWPPPASAAARAAPSTAFDESPVATTGGAPPTAARGGRSPPTVPVPAPTSP